MKKCVISLQSYTHAAKAQKLLSGRGIEAELRRNEQSTEGCGYSLVISIDCDTVAKILNDYSIPFIRLRNEVK